MTFRKAQSLRSPGTPVRLTLFLLLFPGIVVPQGLCPTPSLAVWAFENINISESDTREYVDTLLYHLERAGVFRIVDAGSRVLELVPELSLTGALREDGGSYDVFVRLDDNLRAQTIRIFSRSYRGMGEMFENSRPLAQEIVFEYNVCQPCGDVRFGEEPSAMHRYVFQGTVYEARFSAYMDLVDRIESGTEVSEELHKAIGAYRRKRLGHGIGVTLEFIGRLSAVLGLAGLSGMGGSATSGIDGETAGKALLVLGVMTVAGGCIFWLGGRLSNPKPGKVVEIHNLRAGD